MGEFLPRKLHRAFDQIAMPESLKAMLTVYPSPGWNSFFDHFQGGAVRSEYPGSSGAGTQAVGVSGLGGLLNLVSDTSSGNSAIQALGLNWLPSDGIYFIARAKQPVITTAKFEIGLHASVTPNTGGAVNVKATPTFNDDNFAAFVRDTTDDTAIHFMTNSNASTPTLADEPAGLTLVADTFFVVEIVVKGGWATGYLNGQQVGSGQVGAANGSTPLTPYALALTRTSAARQLDLDYWGIISPRAS